MKKIYFVRHGETTSNVNQTVQGSDDPLTERGRRQAECVARRCQHLTFSALLSSDYARAHDTAKVIAEATEHEVELSELFREVWRPESLVGFPHVSEEVQAYFQESNANMHNDSWKRENEESFRDLSERAAAALRFLAERPEQKLLVVIHGNFLRALAAHVLVGAEAQPKALVRVRLKMQMANTGISEFRYGEDEGWIIETWNDRSHFADE